MVLFSRSLGKLTALILFTFAGLVIWQLTATDSFVFSGQLSDSLQIVNKCISKSAKTLDHPSRVTGSRLPNIVHQIWATRDVRTYSTELNASRDSWKTKFDTIDYTVKLWTDDDVLQLIKTNYTWLLSTYENYPRNIQRADLARLVIVHAEGGIYADLDVYPRSVKQIQCLQHLSLQAIFAPTGGTLGFSNHFFMAERGSSFLYQTLCEAKRRGSAASRRLLLPYLQVFWTTGPTMVTAAYRKYARLYGMQKETPVLLDESYARSIIRHAAGRSWHESDGTALNYMADHAQKTILTGVLIMIILFGLVCGVRKRLIQRAF